MKLVCAYMYTYTHTQNVCYSHTNILERNVDLFSRQKRLNSCKPSKGHTRQW